MIDDIEVRIDGRKGAPKVVEVDAAVIARIIIRITHAQERPAIKAANAIADYITMCMRGAASVL